MSEALQGYLKNGDDLEEQDLELHITGIVGYPDTDADVAVQRFSRSSKVDDPQVEATIYQMYDRIQDVESKDDEHDVRKFEI